MRVPTVVVFSSLAVSSALAGHINIDPDDVSLVMRADHPGVIIQHSEHNAPRAQGDLQRLSLEGAVSLQADTPTQAGQQRPFYTLGSFAEFSTGAHAYALEHATLDADLRIVSSTPAGASLRAVVRVGIYAATPSTFSNLGDNLLYSLSVTDMVAGNTFIDLNENREESADDESFPLELLPAFGQYYLGVTLELDASIAASDAPLPDVSYLLEFGGDTPFQGLSGGVELRRLPAPGAVALFGLAGFTAVGRRRG